MEQPEASVLLAALRPDPGAFKLLASRYARELDWERMLERSQLHKVGALVAHRVFTCEVLGVPEEIRSRLKLFQVESFLRASRSRSTLVEAAGALEAAGVPFVLLKGEFLAEHVYRHARARMPGDVDLLVPADRIHDADRALRSLGYHVADGGKAALRLNAVKERPEPSRRASPSGKEVQYVHTNPSRLPIDLHWQLNDPTIARPCPSLFEIHVIPAAVAGTRVWVLDRETMLVHLATHAAIGNPAYLRFIHFADLAWYLARFGEECDPGRVRAIVREWGLETCLDRAMDVTRDIIGADVPAHLRPHPPRGVVRRACFARVSASLLDRASPRQAKPHGTVRWMQWVSALRMPPGYMVWIVWERLCPLLPPQFLRPLRRSSLYRRIRLKIDRDESDAVGRLGSDDSKHVQFDG